MMFPLCDGRLCIPLTMEGDIPTIIYVYIPNDEDFAFCRFTYVVVNI